MLFSLFSSYCSEKYFCLLSLHFFCCYDMLCTKQNKMVVVVVVASKGGSHVVSFHVPM